MLSAQGRLCCWASVVLQPAQREQAEEQRGGGREGDPGDGPAEWELGFVVHKVGVRDPGSGWCECF